MSMIDMFIPKEAAAKAADAIKAAETERAERIRLALAAAGIENKVLETNLFAASAQAPSLRAAAVAAGKGPLAEILTRVADKLEGR